MTRTMVDSVTTTDDPLRYDMVAGYLNGHYANIPAVKKRFPHATIVTITPDGMAGANVDDRETGDDTPAESAQWAKREQDEDRDPAIYCNLSALRDVLLEIEAKHVARTVLIFTAHWTGKAHICDAACFVGYKLPFTPTVIGTQYANPGMSGGHYDLSLVRDYWPGVDPKPKPVKPKRLSVLVSSAVRIINHWHPKDPLAAKAKERCTRAANNLDAAVKK